MLPAMTKCVPTANVNSGRAVAHNLMERDELWCQKVHASEFGGTIELETLPDGTLKKRKVKKDT